MQGTMTGTQNITTKIRTPKFYAIGSPEKQIKCLVIQAQKTHWAQLTKLSNYLTLQFNIDFRLLSVCCLSFLIKTIMQFSNSVISCDIF